MFKNSTTRARTSGLIFRRLLTGHVQKELSFPLLFRKLARYSRGIKTILIPCLGKRKPRETRPKHGGPPARAPDGMLYSPKCSSMNISTDARKSNPTIFWAPSCHSLIIPLSLGLTLLWVKFGTYSASRS